MQSDVCTSGAMPARMSSGAIDPSGREVSSSHSAGPSMAGPLDPAVRTVADSQCKGTGTAPDGACQQRGTLDSGHTHSRAGEPESETTVVPSNCGVERFSYMMVVAYDGTDFLGYQLQRGRSVEVRTVQKELEHAVTTRLQVSADALHMKVRTTLVLLATMHICYHGSGTQSCVLHM
jgi:hypothetical protein